MYQKRSAFTVIELLIVLGISAVLMGFAGLTFAKQRQNGNLSKAISLYGQDIRYIRSKTISSGVNYRIMPISPNQYKIEKNENGSWTHVSTKTLPANVVFEGDSGQIEFDTRGFAEFPSGAMAITMVFHSGSQHSERKLIYPSMTGSYVVVDGTS